MNNDWEPRGRERAFSADDGAGLAEYFSVADAHRTQHFGLGLRELERRATGKTPDPSLDRHTIFASLLHEEANQMRTSMECTEQMYIDLRFRAQALWCCCFMDSDTCDRIADLVEGHVGWLGRANFIAALEKTRDSLGAIFGQEAFDVPKPETAARQRLRRRWEEEAVAFRFESGTSAADRADWIAGLDAGSLHDYVLKFDWEETDLSGLHAIIDHPNCDRATAMSLYAAVGPDHYDGLDENACDGYAGALFALLDKLHRRVEAGDFAPSMLQPAEEMAQWQVYRDVTLGAGRPMRWVFSDHAFEDLGWGEAKPTYVFRPETGAFLTAFETWSAIRVVSADEPVR